MHIPATPDELTAGWLMAALQKGGAIDQAMVASYSVEALDGDKGFVAQIVRVHLTYDREEAGAPRTLIAKFSLGDAARRKQMRGGYTNEVRFYRELACQAGVPAPACYYADMEPETGEHVLLLEDLAGAQNGSRPAGCSPDQAQAAIDQIARFHAAWWETPAQAKIDWLQDMPIFLEPAILQEAYNQWWPRFYQRAGASLTASGKEIGLRFGQKPQPVRRHLFIDAPRTLIHKDFQADNLFFGVPDAPGGFVAVDWQGIARGRGIFDVAYLLSESMQIEDRRAIEADLLRSYHQTLLDHGVQGYSFADCLYDYRLSLLHRFTALVSTLAVMPFSNEQLRMHIDLLLPRNNAAMLDHNVAELLQ